MIDYTLEKQFIASLIADTSRITQLEKEVNVSDFKDPLFYDIYSEIISCILSNRNVTYSNLRLKFNNDKIVRTFLDEIEKEEKIDDINFLYKELLNSSQKVKIRELGGEIINDCKSDKTAVDIITKTESKLLNIGASSSITLDSLVNKGDDVIRGINEKVVKFNKCKDLQEIIDLPTGFKTLDSLTLGIEAETIWVIAASSSDGKTMAAIQISNNITSRKKTVLYFLLEGSHKSLIYRWLSLRTGIPISKIKCGDLSEKEHKKVLEMYEILKQNNNLLFDDRMREIDEIVNKVKFAKLKNKDLGLVVIDYIQLVSDNSKRFGNREQEISSVSKKLISLSKSCSIGILTLAQLNVNPDERSKGMPIRINDIRECKAVGHDAHVVLAINFPDKYKSDEDFSKKNGQFIIIKNREGESQKIIPVKNYANIAKFVEE